MSAPFEVELSQRVWEQRYRYRPEHGPAERSVADMQRRVAHGAASVEDAASQAWEARFLGVLQDFRFLPGGRILAAAGTPLRATLLNCFVMGDIRDSVEGIFTALKEGALTMQAGGGVGYDFSTLRPRGERASTTGSIASGPVSFMHVWDAACATITGSGPRGGAMMATLRCDHPDILEFIEAKRAGGLRHFNLSVQISDAFMQALAARGSWPLVFPVATLAPTAQRLPGVTRRLRAGEQECAVLRTIDAQLLWDRLLRASFDRGDPGVLFIDTINRQNPLHYSECLTATNPCGELPLPAYGACDLGSLNLVQFVRRPFSAAATIDVDALTATARVAVRFLDNILDVSHYPLAAQREQVLRTRRIGLGVTGLADALILLGLNYDSDAARALSAEVIRGIRDAAYEASIELAQQKGAFPAFDADGFLAGEYVGRLPAKLRDGIARHGMRNGGLLALAPAGSISLLANNVSSGIEPVFAFQGERRMRTIDGWERCPTADYAWRHWREQFGPAAKLSDAFVTAQELTPAAHLQMQAALQPMIDGAISKTINLPAAYPFESCREIFASAYRLGLKGCTIFRAATAGETVLSGPASEHAPADARQCCMAH